MPHMLPCPVPAKRYADGDVVVDENGRRRRFRARERAEESRSGIVQFGADVEDAPGSSSARRECPVPKPGGILGEWLGFHKGDDDVRNK